MSGEDLDVALVVKMLAPRSYTGEDVVELSCHGNSLLLGVVIRLLLLAGARLAEPGEFTRRAYLNGRLGLLQAEAIAELIGARTERAVRLSARQLRGGLATAIETSRERLLELVAGLEVELDFPEDEVGTSRGVAREQAADLAKSIDRLAVAARHGRAIQSGIAVLLAGSPNVGKSSLLNALLGEERAIVAPSPGTTRDLVHGELEIGGVSVRLTDGAGLGTPNDVIDAEGMRRVRQALGESDVVLVILDRSRDVSLGDREVLAITANHPRLIVANKSDLAPAWDYAELGECVCSARTGAGVDRLKAWLREWVEQRAALDGDEGGSVASLRVIDRLEAAGRALRHGAEELGHAPAEAVLVDLREALTALEQTLGVQAEDAVLDRIFATFCVGK
jgi:tRNA modification GTPase